jgi:homoserine kinase
MKGILGIVAVSALLSIAPASAAEMDCTDANLTKASGDMDKMPADEKKTIGMKEMTAAKEMMGKKDMAGCKMQMNKAIEMGMGMSK